MPDLYQAVGVFVGSCNLDSPHIQDLPSAPFLWKAKVMSRYNQHYMQTARLLQPWLLFIHLSFENLEGIFY